MRLIRFENAAGTTLFGEPLGDGKARVHSGSFATGFTPTQQVEQVVRLLAPAAGSILGIGANYKRLFVDKPLPPYPVVYYSLPNALGSATDPVQLPRSLSANKTKYEGELVVVVGKTAKNISREEALSYVFGYSIGNDLTCNDWTGEAVGNQWSKGKGFDGFKPCGPCLVTADEIPDPSQLRIVTELNGTEVQNELVSGMVHDVAACISFLSKEHTLQPGDLIFTGTPFGLPGQVPGAEWLKPGDTVRIRIDPIGEMITKLV